MKSAAQLADMTDEAFERYLKRKGISGMGAVNVSAKRREELRKRAVTSTLLVQQAEKESGYPDLDALADAIERGQDGHETSI